MNQQKTQQRPDLVTVEEAAARFKEQGVPVSAYSVRRLIRSNQVPARLVGGRWLISWRRLNDYLTFSDGGESSVPDNENQSGRNICQVRL